MAGNIRLSLVSDDKILRDIVAYEASSRGMIFRNGPDADSDIILLDLDFLSRQKRDAQTKIYRGAQSVGLFREPKSAEVFDKSELGFCLRRPFDADELFDRIAKLAEEGKWYRESEEEMLLGNTAGIEELSLEKRGNNVFLGYGKKLEKLSPTEASVAKLLFCKRGKTVDRSEIAGVLLQDDAKSNTPEVYICFLRRKISKITDKNLLVTVRGRGYMLK